MSSDGDECGAGDRRAQPPHVAGQSRTIAVQICRRRRVAMFRNTCRAAHRERMSTLPRIKQNVKVLLPILANTPYRQRVAIPRD